MSMSSSPDVAFSQPCFGLEEEEAAAQAIRSRWVVGGPRLAEFENRFAEACGAEAAVGVSSWTTGAFLLLKALGVGPGDEVIVPSLTFIASVNVIVHAGATPVFADIDPVTFNIDPDDAERKITPKTHAILPVDQVGLPCDIDRFQALAAANNLILIQDAACSFGSKFRGAPVGSQAPHSVFSLHARKVITTGEGGMIVTKDGELSAKLRRLRHQGMSLSDYQRHASSPTTFESYPEIGYNFRITDIQAAVGVAQIGKLDAFLARRRAIAQAYLDGLKNHAVVVAPTVPQHVTPNWQSFQVRVRDGQLSTRNALMEHFYRHGVATRRGVMASHLEEPYRHMNAKLPHTEAVASSSLQLPIFPGMTNADVERVLEVLSFFAD
ncbi:DegT/DnrJ/EryC1/StrS aminotransferase family protein [Bradyrhizobium sp. WSM1417]|uniref:DegT/DnrJ/EryC1/StrS family aminotransferase n=1 Tax=Bradyrhizobium sp. WSM1417 TaxID=754500 RepID=UPI0006879700|nr:DegT/DnrJ/EryC1/StrS family aminotransferase [Bradyrhizobium sp. WSM1417]